MNFKKNKLTLLLVPALASMAMTGCNSDHDGPNELPLVCEAPQIPNDDGSACIIPPGDISNPIANPNLDIDPPAETIVAAANELIVNYVDPNATPGAGITPYEAWSLHLWNNETCSALTDEQAVNDWANTTITPDGADDYGPYWSLDLETETGCVNMILRAADGNTKIINADLKIDLDTHTDRTVALVGADSTVYDTREEAFNTNPPGINKDNRNAHWVDANTIVWGESGDRLALYVSQDGTFGLNSDGTLAGNYMAYELTAGEMSDAVKAQFPQLEGRNAFTLPEDADAKAALKGQLYVAALSAEGWITKVSKLQIPGALDALYTAGEADANEQPLGAMTADGMTSFALWAPTAQDVKVHLFDAEMQPIGEAPVAMTEDANGIWKADAEVGHGTYYKFEVTVYHYSSDKIETLMVTDPYSMGLSENSVYSQVIDFTAADVTPEGWTEHEVPMIDPAAISIYESHIRDFSAFDASTDEDKRGKYLAFTQTDSDPMQHILELQKAGLTHFHLLPAFDIATVNEDPAMRVDLNDTVGKLCGINPNSYLCSEDQATTLLEVLEACDETTQCAETAMDEIRGLDSFNWGYDPFHYGVPEGSYASDADGVARIMEFRQMVQTLHENGLKVALDVVYNHTNASGLNDKSVLDKVVPGYYNRFNADTGMVETSTCCDNTATEFAMMEKLMTDTLVTWSNYYKIDSFRFDLMGHQPLDAMERSLTAVQAVDPDTYFYGEGWNFGEVENDRLFTQATQLNLAGTGIGSFSDRGRDHIRGGSPFDEAAGIRTAQGFANGLYSNPNELNSGSEGEKTQLLASSDVIRVELAGGLKDFALIDSTDTTVRGSGVDYNGQPSGYTESPLELVSYVSKHDNQTLWDNNQYKLPEGLSTEERVRYQNFALSFPLLGQGVPFLHMGSDLLRSKSMERDSYDSGDWYNYVDFTKEDNNWNVGLPRDDKDGANYDTIQPIIADVTTMPAMVDMELNSAVFNEFLSIRKSSKLFKLGTKESVMGRVDFHNMGSEQTPGVIVMSIDDGTSAGADLDPNADAIVIVFNSTQDDYVLNVGGLELHEVQQDSADVTYDNVIVEADKVTVPAVTAAVFVLPQGEAQGAGIPVAEKSFANTAPFGATKVYLRGDMNGWSTDHEMRFDYDGLYSDLVELAAGTYNFKVADANWGDVNYGFGNVTVAEGSLAIVDADGNMSLEIAEDGVYRFDFNARDTEAATISVRKDEAVPFGEATPLLRGDMNGWGDIDAFAYDGVGVYTFKGELADGSYAFKIADADWGAQGINLGGGQTVYLDEATVLVADSQDNLSITLTEAAEYTFTLDASILSKPTLHVEKYEEVVEPATCDVLDPSTDADPLNGTPLYVRGDHSGWSAEAAYQLTYKGNNVYQANFTKKGQMMFKIADNTDGWTTQFYVPTSMENDAPLADLELSKEYTAWVKSGGQFNNNSVTLPDAEVVFTLTISDAEANNAQAGTLEICERD